MTDWSAVWRVMIDLGVHWVHLHTSTRIKYAVTIGVNWFYNTIYVKCIILCKGWMYVGHAIAVLQRIRLPCMLCDTQWLENMCVWASNGTSTRTAFNFTLTLKSRKPFKTKFEGCNKYTHISEVSIGANCKLFDNKISSLIYNSVECIGFNIHSFLT